MANHATRGAPRADVASIRSDKIFRSSIRAGRACGGGGARVGGVTAATARRCRARRRRARDATPLVAAARTPPPPRENRPAEHTAIYRDDTREGVRVVAKTTRDGARRRGFPHPDAPTATRPPVGAPRKSLPGTTRESLA